MSTGSALSSKKEGQTGRRPVWAAKIYTCPLMRTMMKSSLGPQLQGGEASEYLWDCFRGLCSSPKSWALSMVCWAGWAGQAGLGLTVNIQSTYSQHTVNIQSTRQSTCKETLIIYIHKVKVCVFFGGGGGGYIRLIYLKVIICFVTRTCAFPSRKLSNGGHVDWCVDCVLTVCWLYVDCMLTVRPSPACPAQRAQSSLPNPAWAIV